MSHGVSSPRRHWVSSFAIRHVADVAPASLVVGLLQCQRLVEPEAAAAGKAAQVALLFAVRSKRVLEGLEPPHRSNYMGYRMLRRHTYWVSLSRYSHAGFTRPRSPVGELAPKVCVFSPVNSLKGVSSRLIRLHRFPNIPQELCGGALWSPSYFAG